MIVNQVVNRNGCTHHPEVIIADHIPCVESKEAEHSYAYAGHTFFKKKQQLSDL